MIWAHLVTLFALIEYIAFSALVSRARGKFKIMAPATTGHDIFERYYRVQMNTLELLVVFIPALLLSAIYWSAPISAAVGLVFLVGRVVYLRAYVAAPTSRALGYFLSVAPIMVLIVAALIGMLGRLYLQAS